MNKNILIMSVFLLLRLEVKIVDRDRWLEYDLRVPSEIVICMSLDSVSLLTWWLNNTTKGILPIVHLHFDVK